MGILDTKNITFVVEASSCSFLRFIIIKEAEGTVGTGTELAGWCKRVVEKRLSRRSQVTLLVSTLYQAVPRFRGLKYKKETVQYLTVSYCTFAFGPVHSSFSAHLYCLKCCMGWERLTLTAGNLGAVTRSRLLVATTKERKVCSFQKARRRRKWINSAKMMFFGIPYIDEKRVLLGHMISEKFHLRARLCYMYCIGDDSHQR